MTGHVPQRTCIVCRYRTDKAELLRFVSDEAGFLFYDAKGDKSGRGFYLCRKGSCLEKYIRIPKKYSTKFRLREIVPESVKQLKDHV
ncbi:MAG: DUF448 domain-containing protein [Xanthomonadaceae bacterium]|nr:DUF448 domain-containing protein [Xanthomonadaceae bacterium]